MALYKALLLTCFKGLVCTYSLQRILSVLEQKPEDLSEAYGFAFIIFVTHLSFAQVDLFQSWHSRRSYERARGQLFCAIHHKALRRRDISTAAVPMKDGKATAVSGADLGKIVSDFSTKAVFNLPYNGIYRLILCSKISLAK